jgi:hypothetical protein
VLLSGATTLSGPETPTAAVVLVVVMVKMMMRMMGLLS